MGGSEENGDRVYQHRGIVNSVCEKVSILKSSSNGVVDSDSFYGSSSNWDPIVSLNQSGNYVMVENQRILGSSSHLVHFPSLVDDMVPSFGSGMVTSFGHNVESNLGVANSQNPCQDWRASSSYGKRKREEVYSPKNDCEEEQQKDHSGDMSEFPREDDEKKQRFEKNIGQNSRGGKQALKQTKDNSVGAEPSKENYIHVRAKRGQATNSHSLAERVRRERISERMRLLQELVPGCNKITGKAMMLDEIINYVQSLQQQVEFLSMKLATVNPELNVDIDRILSKDILHLRGSNATALGIAPGLSSSPHPFPGYPQGAFNGTPGGTTAPFISLPQHIWNNELQSILQTGFDPDPSVSMGLNGLSKMEL